jgi:hypothetical protein
VTITASLPLGHHNPATEASPIWDALVAELAAGDGAPTMTLPVIRRGPGTAAT